MNTNTALHLVSDEPLKVQARICTCGAQENEETPFGKNQNRCKKCIAKRQAEWFQKNKEERRAKKLAYRHADPEKARAQDRKWKSAHREQIKLHTIERMKKDPIQGILKITKARAKKNGVPFNLTREDIFIPEFCPIFGIKLTYGGPMKDSTMSIDRLIPSLGYTRGNVNIISMKANYIKNFGTASEHEIIAAWMRSKVTV